MNHLFWILFRVAFVALFGVEFAKVATGSGVFPLDAGLKVFLPIAYIFAAWRFSGILRRRYEKKKEKDDWAASLWNSPILKNPESFFFIGGLAFVIGSLLGWMIAMPPMNQLGMLSMEFVFGAGILSGWALFRFRYKKRANQAAQTTPGLRPSVSDL